MVLAMTVVSMAGWTPELAAARVIGTLVFLTVCGGYALVVTGRFAGRFALATVHGVQRGNEVMRRAKSINRIRTARALVIAVIVALSLAASATKSEATVIIRCGDWCWWI